MISKIIAVFLGILCFVFGVAWISLLVSAPNILVFVICLAVGGFIEFLFLTLLDNAVDNLP